MTDEYRVKHIVESVLMAAGKPMSLDQLLAVFDDAERPGRDELRAALTDLQEDYSERGIELVEVGSGFRIQVSQRMEPWVSRLTEEKTVRYSRALLETLALVAYRQPITRGEIEDIRGVSVSSSIMKTLQEREWVRVIGHRDVPGRPAMYGTTRQFLDYFNLKGLDDLPSLMELRDIDTINAELDLALPGERRPLEDGAGDEDVAAAEDAEDRTVDTPVPAVVAVQLPVEGADGSETLH